MSNEVIESKLILMGLNECHQQHKVQLHCHYYCIILEYDTEAGAGH